MTVERRGARWRGWGVPLQGSCGSVVLSTTTTLLCRLDVSGASTASVVAVHADASRPRAALAIALDRRPAVQVAVGAAVTIHNGVLRLASHGHVLTADLRSATVWMPPLPQRLDASSREVLREEIALVVGPALTVGIARLHGRLDELLAALGAPSEPTMAAAVRRLIGFGPGLTPSGDDVLCGALVTLARSPDHAATFLLLARAVLDALAGTTDVSASMLRFAARGEGDQALDAVLSSSMLSHVVRVRSIGRLLAVGATSGADTLVGVCAALVASPSLHVDAAVGAGSVLLVGAAP